MAYYISNNIHSNLHLERCLLNIEFYKHFGKVSTKDLEYFAAQFLRLVFKSSMASFVTMLYKYMFRTICQFFLLEFSLR